MSIMFFGLNCFILSMGHAFILRHSLTSFSSEVLPHKRTLVLFSPRSSPTCRFEPSLDESFICNLLLCRCHTRNPSRLLTCSKCTFLSFVFRSPNRILLSLPPFATSSPDTFTHKLRMHTNMDAPLHSRIGPLSQRVFDPIDLSPAAYRCLQ